MGSDRVGCRVSLLALLATGAGTPIDPPDPVDGVRAAIVAQLDPANYPGRVFTVGTDHATVAGTIALADAASSVGNWSLVMVPNGVTYAERIVRPAPGTAAFTDVRTVDLDGEPFTLNPPDGTDDTWEHRGIGGILANAILNGKGSKSAVHSGEYSAGADTEYIYYNVTGTQTGTSNDAFSWGVGPGQRILDWVSSKNTQTQTVLRGVAVTLGIIFVIIQAVASRGAMARIIISLIAAGIFIWGVWSVTDIKDRVGNEMSMGPVAVQVVPGPAGPSAFPSTT